MWVTMRTQAPDDGVLQVTPARGASKPVPTSEPAIGWRRASLLILSGAHESSSLPWECCEWLHCSRPCLVPASDPGCDEHGLLLHAWQGWPFTLCLMLLGWPRQRSPKHSTLPVCVYTHKHSFRPSKQHRAGNDPACQRISNVSICTVQGLSAGRLGQLTACRWHADEAAQHVIAGSTFSSCPLWLCRPSGLLLAHCRVPHNLCACLPGSGSTSCSTEL